jgi:hypothetical protein
MIVVGMGNYYVVDVVIRIVVSDMFDYGIGRVYSAAVYNMEVITRTVIAVPNDDRIAIAVSDRQEINLE